MKFSWQSLKKPFFALAPMEGGTDTVFRQIIASCGRPDVMFTEFTNVEGLLSSGRQEVERRLFFENLEKPLIAQIWGKNPDAYYQVSKQLKGDGFDGIDINMGCPERTVVKNGCCSALIENQPLAKEIIEAVRKGSDGLPVSVKTRIGFKTIETERWIGFLLEQNLDALTVHLRTQKEMSNVPAHWEEARKIVKIKKQKGKSTILIGNGDVFNLKQGRELSNKYDLNGIMIGRGAFYNPYVFDEFVDYETQTKEQRIELLKKHLNLFEKTWLEKYKVDDTTYKKLYPPLKRYFKIYISGFEGASDLRVELMQTKSINEVKAVLAS